MTESSWGERPSEDEIKSRIDEFMRALQRADLVQAFALCPLEGVDVSDRAALFEYLSHAMFQFLDEAEGAQLEEPHTWLRSLTPPSECSYEDFALEIDDDEDGGEVLANVYLNGEVSDITARYDLNKRSGRWLLTFENFDIM